MTTKPTSKRDSPEVRERAVRMVREHQGDLASQWEGTSGDPVSFQRNPSVGGPMTTYEANHFEGSVIKLDGDAWLRNVMEQCRIEVADPPQEFTGNRVVDCDMQFSGAVAATMAFLRGLCADNPEMRDTFREILGLNDDAGGNTQTH